MDIDLFFSYIHSYYDHLHDMNRYMYTCTAKQIEQIHNQVYQQMRYIILKCTLCISTKHAHVADNKLYAGKECNDDLFHFWWIILTIGLVIWTDINLVIIWHIPHLFLDCLQGSSLVGFSDLWV